jgi:hypothetical protein
METDEHNHGEGVELPVPTAYPITTAFGITLIALGLLTTLFIALVGVLIAGFGAVGWFRAVFPVPEHEYVPLARPELRAAAVKLSPRRVNHLELGSGGHRTYYPVRVHRYSSGVYGGLAGGAAMGVIAMIYGQLFHNSVWYPINLLAAAGLPKMAEADVNTLCQFNLTAFVIALIAHGAFSILIGLLYTVLLPMLPPRFEWFWGGIFTPLIWTAMIYPMFDIINPALAQRVDWVWFVICQVAFGLVGGYVVFRSEKVQTMQSWTMAERLSLHAMEKK